MNNLGTTENTTGKYYRKYHTNKPGSTRTTTERLQEVHEKLVLSKECQETLQESREAPEMWS